MPIARSLARSWRALTRGAVPKRERITSDSVVAPGRPVADALEHIAIGDPGGREEHVFARAQIIGGEIRSRS